MTSFQFLGTALVQCDVLHRACGADRLAIGATKNLADVLVVALGFAGQEDAIINRVGFSGLGSLAQGFAKICPVVRVNALEEQFDSRRSLFLPGVAKEPVSLFRPPEVSCRQVPFPAADSSDALGLGQPLLALLQFRSGFHVTFPLASNQVALGLPQEQCNSAGHHDEEDADKDHQADAFVQWPQHFALVNLGD